MSKGAPPCDRCQARGLACHVEKPSHSNIDEANHWRSAITGRVAQLQTAVNVLLRMSELPMLSSYGSPETLDPDQHSQREFQVTNSETGEAIPSAPVETPVAPVDDALYGLPINSLYEVTRLPSLKGDGKNVSAGNLASADFISRGLITRETAQQLFQRYTDRLDFFCYGIMCPYDSLEAVRASSTLLTAAVCTVAALHDSTASATFKICHTELLSLYSRRFFSLAYSTDDIRALIIGSYWLGNISYSLIGHAIRVATRLNYHLAYFSAIDGDADAKVKARLWYVLYIIDHHSSILYGRPAIISPTEEPHQQWETFIQTGGNCEIDLRMSSQVALYHITAKVKNIFGSYSIPSVPEHFLHQLRGYFAELDRWYMVWGNRMPKNAHVGWFPRDGAILHYHFARLHLCSYIFRGMTVESAINTSAQVREYASVAVASATAVLNLVLERDDLRNALVGMPIYFHAMITFAAVFLLKAARTNFMGLTAVDTSNVLELEESLVRELRAQNAAQQHLVYHLSNGLQDMIRSLHQAKGEAEARKASEHEEMVTTPGHHANSVDVVDAAGAALTMDSMFSLDTFDLLQYSLDENDGEAMAGSEWEGQGWIA